MEWNKTLRMIAIVTVSAMVTILTTPVESMPLRDSFVSRHLLHVFPPSNPPSESESPSPAPGQKATTPITMTTNPSTEIDIDSPAASPEAPASSISPAGEIDINSPAGSPEAPASSISPAGEIDMDSSEASPEAPASSTSPAGEIDAEEIEMDSPAPSPADYLSSFAPNLLKQPLLSPEIRSICGKTDNPLLCESSISPLLKTLFKPDASSVLVLAIQASITATKAAMSTVNRVAGADCQELYDAAVSALEDAGNAVKEGDVAAANINLSAAMTDYVTCNDGFEEAGEVNPLVDVADRLTKMVSNCLAISALIK